MSDTPAVLRARLLLLLEEHHNTGSPHYVNDDQLATATGESIDQVRRQLDILEELGLTTTANSRDGRRARISTRGLMETERLRSIPPEEPQRRRIGFGTDT